MREKFSRGAETFAAIAAASTGARRVKAQRMAGMGFYMARTLGTAIHVKQGALAHFAKDTAAVLRWAKQEYANAAATLPLVEADSRLGWEVTMDYVGGPVQIRWKLERMAALYGDAVKKID
jgi:hypothetical protein